ncbi:MAG TPA: cytochrome bc complex cytochrome b subunit [Syntrophorhabdaceae bacterium]|nr:cytochrome bc complex cytochrome b subunit [Syntrophorhabdaceae bacterium]
MSCRRLKDWFDERYDLEGLAGIARGKHVPSHRHDIWYFAGGLTLFLFCIQFITGMALAFYYVPHPEHAHKSIIEIVTKLNMGWLFRSIHHWGAQLAIVVLFIHLFSTLLLKAYRKPRELLWVTGFVMLAVSIFFGLSGYFLLWDERAFAAVRVATGGAGNLPVVGGLIKGFLRGGIDVTGETLTRFYAFHVAVLPIVTLALAGAHVVLVQVHGMSVPLSQQHRQGRPEPFFPDMLCKDMIIWLIFLGIVVTLAVLLPPEIGKKADPLAPAPENIKPEWYFLFLFETLKLFPGEILGLNGETIAILVISAAILFFFLIPFVDRRSAAQQKSPVFTWIGILYVVYFAVMTFIGFVS